MNPENVNLIERPYQEVVDDILTAIVGGVVNEPIIFDLKVDLYPLAEPAQDVRGITGTVEKKRHSFQKEIDFLFNEDKNAVIWQEGGTWPDDETVFHVDYFRKDSRSPLTDINVGSVTRTLGEAIGREITTVYQQINRAYLSAFIDTAEGKSLDLVVAILRITRKTKDFAVGQVTFFRDPATKGFITISEGISVETAKGEVVFQTTQPRTLQQGQVRIDVPIRASDDFKGNDGVVSAGDIIQLTQTMAGIARVTNFEPTFLSAEDESDTELRARAKAVLRGLGKGTMLALYKVISDGRALLTEVWDPNGPPAKRSTPGTVVLMLESEPERFPSLQNDIHETRSAGVQAALIVRYIYFKPRLIVKIKSGLPAAGKTKVANEIIAALQAYVDSLSSGDPVEGGVLYDKIKGTEDVIDAKIVDVMTWRTDVGHPGTETLVDAVMTGLDGAVSEDREAQLEAIETAIAEISPLVPSGKRIPDRSLVKGLDGERATDEKIEAGDFQVVAMIDDEKWWVVLDIKLADILLVEKES